MKCALRILASLGVLALYASAAGTVKRASFAGQFYEKEPARLAASIDAALARGAPAAAVDGKIIALIAPHAGYIYSGETAASAYALVKGRPIETVVVIGPSHQVGFRGCSIWPKGGFETPLGIVRVDEDLAGAIMKASRFRFHPEAFAKEHSVEVQLPFIQRVLPEAAIVPIVMGYQDRRTIETLADALAKTCLDRNVLIVASTDLSHFLSKDGALARDTATADLIRSLETETLIRKIEAGENIMCGGGPVVSALLLARKAGRPRVEILQRADSAGFGGPVVGYLAAAVLSDNGTGAAPLLLSSDDKSALLRLARSAIEEYIERGRIIDPPVDNPEFLIPRGVFVTIKKQDRLRGCIGFSEPVMPLGPAVIRAAILAAVKDSRFPPVERAELRDLRIELSVLTPPEEIDDFRAVHVGRHGLIVTQGEKSGLLLPQVPVDNGWNRRTFLQQASLKAGLAADAWRRGATLHVFETIVFHE